MPAEFPYDPLHRLAQRVVHGDVVFFVGSGFSIDSEGNTAARLMRRLLIRLTAMAQILGPAAEAVRNDLVSTFGISGQGTELFPYSDEDVRSLSQRYYETNEWFCSAFGSLLDILGPSSSERKSRADAIAQREEQIRSSRRKDGTERDAAPIEPIDAVPFEPIDLGLLDLLRTPPDGWRAAGKALFLDTMGFRNPAIMGGEPACPSPDAMLGSYGDRLLTRHHVIARLAREGFCTKTITTNYDRLLEGAFRVAGFGYPKTEGFSPDTYYSDFACITSPLEFFTEGKAHRTAVVLKIHGCSRHYRDDARKDPDAVAAYLRSMVFTYREIQNWRADTWAADCLRTLLRTQTVVFCGYSLQDPVIHDTFRTVYEEMAGGYGPAAGTDSEKAPAFFFAPGRDCNEFYGMEVLRAAGAAVGQMAAPLSPHRNYIRFYFRSEPEFPHLDEAFRWLFHDVFRIRQEECLKTELHRTVAALLGRPRPERELETVRAAFREVCELERARAKHWDRAQSSRQEHAAICGWTDGFHNALLREMACAEELARGRAEGRKLGRMRQIPWHYPTTGRPAWTCWGAVLEVALRRMIEHALGREPFTDGWLIRGGGAMEPTILFPSRSNRALHGLTIVAEGLDQHPRQAWRQSGTVRHLSWLLPCASPLWPPAGAGPRQDTADNWVPLGHSVGSAPDAGVVWRWASGTTQPQDVDMLEGLLGLTRALGVAV